MNVSAHITYEKVFAGHIRGCKCVIYVHVFGEPHSDILLCLRAENVNVIGFKFGDVDVFAVKNLKRNCFAVIIW